MRPKDERAAPFVMPVRLRNLIWLPVVIGAWGAMDQYGTPHLRLRYVWSGSASAPFYHSCSYWGLHPFQLNPSDGACPLIRLALPLRGGN